MSSIKNSLDLGFIITDDNSMFYTAMNILIQI